MALLFLSLAIALVYMTAVSIYRLCFSPLSKIPGPKLAALTLLYEVYYDVLLGGQYTFKIVSLHRQYGPIVRISPHEIHISDPDFYQELYSTCSRPGERRHKYKWFTDSFGLDQSTFSTWDHDLHRVRRGALAVCFSRENVRSLNGLIRERVGVLLRRLGEFRDGQSDQRVVNMSHAYAAFTNDVVMTYSFARCDRRLEAADFDPSYRAASHFGSTAQNYLKHAPWVNTLMQALPDGIAERLHGAMTEFVRQKRNTFAQISAVKAGPGVGFGSGPGEVSVDEEEGSSRHATVFHSILENPKLPEREKTAERLADDAQVLMMAGTLTTAWTLEATTFWLLELPDVLGKLKAELVEAMPNAEDKTPLVALEKLPYLTAVIKEGLRLTYGVSCRLARIDPDKDTRFTDKATGKVYTIPRGTPVGMTSVQIHHDESLFPDSKRFWPERWLLPSAKEKNLDRYMVSFTAGTRQCVGKELAYAELYLCLSALWRRWGSKHVRAEGDDGWLELWETRIQDVEIEADHFLPFQQKESKGIRVRVGS